MQIVFHLGAHDTDGGLLIRSILKNRAALAEAGIVVPGPGRYKDLLREVSTQLRGQPASRETEEMVIDAIVEDERAERLVLSNENFLCRPTVVLDRTEIYPKAAKAAWLANVFPRHRAEFALAICNPATFVPKMLSRLDRTRDAWPERLAAIDLFELSWADTVQRIRDAVPGHRIVVWCNEDTPILWGEIMSELAGVEADAPLSGTLDRVQEILTPDGFRHLTALLEARGEISERERRRIVAGFLDAHARPDAVVEEIDVPGWTADTVARLSALYDDDIEEIRSMPDVDLIGG